MHRSGRCCGCRCRVAAAVPVPSRAERRFVLGVLADDAEPRGFTLSEDLAGRLDPVAGVSPHQARLMWRAVADAVAADGYAPDALGPHRKRPFNLTQSPGVRLALQTLAAAPLRNPVRRGLVIAGIEAMGDEERLYWFAKVRGQDGRRALRALRLLLADG